MKIFNSLLALVVAFLLVSVPAEATDSKLKNNMHVTGNLTVDGTTSFSGSSAPSSLAVTNNATIGGTLGVTGLSTLGSLTVSGATTLTTPLTSANIQSGSAKRELLIAKVCPAGGAVTVNGTVYFAMLYPTRAGTVKQIAYSTHVDPISGTNTIKVLKATSAGNTMINASSVSLNGTTIDTATIATLTATGADLVLTAGQPIYCEYSAGTQGAVAKDVTVTIEYEPTDF